MFRFVNKSLDIITLFHKPSLPSSVKVYTLLKQAHASTSEHATLDQASDHTPQSIQQHQEFELDVTEEPPTPDQLRTILEYVGAQRAGTIIKGAKDEADAMRKLKENGDNFQRPLTVDWNNGRAVIGDDKSEILKLLASLPKH